MLLLLTVCCGAQDRVVRHVAPRSDLFPDAWYPEAPKGEPWSMPAPVEGKPYSAVWMLSRVREGALPVRLAAEKRQRDRDGRTRTERLLPAVQGIARRQVEVHDPVSHCSFSWFEELPPKVDHVASVDCLPRVVNYSKSEDVVEAVLTLRRSDAANESYEEEDLADREIEGLTCKGILEILIIEETDEEKKRRLRSRRRDPAPRPVRVASEQWVSPDIGELMLWVRGEQEMRLTNVVAGDVQPSLFYPPDGYRIVAK